MIYCVFFSFCLTQIFGDSVLQTKSKFCVNMRRIKFRFVAQCTFHSSLCCFHCTIFKGQSCSPLLLFAQIWLPFPSSAISGKAILRRRLTIYDWLNTANVSCVNLSHLFSRLAAIYIYSFNCHIVNTLPNLTWIYLLNIVVAIGTVPQMRTLIGWWNYVYCSQFGHTHAHTHTHTHQHTHTHNAYVSHTHRVYIIM